MKQFKPATIGLRLGFLDTQILKESGHAGTQGGPLKNTGEGKKYACTRLREPGSIFKQTFMIITTTTRATKVCNVHGMSLK